MFSQPQYQPREHFVQQQGSKDLVYWLHPCRETWKHLFFVLFCFSWFSWQLLHSISFVSWVLMLMMIKPNTPLRWVYDRDLWELRWMSANVSCWSNVPLWTKYSFAHACIFTDLSAGDVCHHCSLGQWSWHHCPKLCFSSKHLSLLCCQHEHYVHAAEQTVAVRSEELWKTISEYCRRSVCIRKGRNGTQNQEDELREWKCSFLVKI